MSILLVAESAQAFVFGDGMVPDPVDGSALSSLPGETFEGLPVWLLADLLGQYDRSAPVPAQRYDPALVVDLQELQGALRIGRSSEGITRYRLALKEFATAAHSDARLKERIAPAAGMILDATVQAADALQQAKAQLGFEAMQPSPERRTAEAQWHALPEWDSFLALVPFQRGLEAQMGENASTDAESSLDQLKLFVNLLWPQAQMEWNVGRLGFAVSLWDEALAIAGMVVAARATGINRTNISMLLSNRGAVKRSSASHGAEAAIADFDAVIDVMKKLRVDFDEAWRQSPGPRYRLAGAYMNRGAAKNESASHGAELAIADFDSAIEIMKALRADLGEALRQSPEMRNGFANVYMNRGNAKRTSAAFGADAAIADHDAAVELMEELRDDLGEAWRQSTELTLGLARAYMNRGNARQESAAHGVDEVITDYCSAIELMEGLRADLGEVWRQSPELRNYLAKTYGNLGTIKHTSAAHGPDAAIADYDDAIEIMEDLRDDLGTVWIQSTEPRNDLASLYMNRGISKEASTVHGAEAAIADYDAAIKLREELRDDLGAAWRLSPDMRSDLAIAYINRGNSKEASEAHGADAAIADQDAAIDVLEELRGEFGMFWRQSPGLHSALSGAYLNRGIAKKATAAHGAEAAIPDYDSAIELMEGMRGDLSETWDQWPGLRLDLARVYFNRGNAKQASAKYGATAAIADYEVAIELLHALTRDAPHIAPTFKSHLDFAEAQLRKLKGST
ncbi:MAG: hypothetical protein WDZ83_00300 [Rhizobiaceae bacterium]